MTRDQRHPFVDPFDHDPLTHCRLCTRCTDQNEISRGRAHRSSLLRVKFLPVCWGVVWNPRYSKFGKVKDFWPSRSDVTHRSRRNLARKSAVLRAKFPPIGEGVSGSPPKSIFGLHKYPADFATTRRWVLYCYHGIL